MKKFFLRLPTTNEKVIVTVDDDDAWRLRNQMWNCKRKKNGLVEIYRSMYGVSVSLGQDVMNVTQDGMYVTHKNSDYTDFRKCNLLVLTRKEGLMLTRLSSSSANIGYCANGHRLSGENVYKKKDGRRQCKLCMSICAHKNYIKRKRTQEFMGADAQ